MGDTSIMSRRLLIGSDTDTAIHNQRGIIDESMMDPSIIFPDLWIAHEGGAIHNPRDIIDEEPIYIPREIIDE